MASDNKKDTGSNKDQTDHTTDSADSKTTADSDQSSSDIAATAKKAPPILSDQVTPPPENGTTESPKSSAKNTSQSSGKSSEKSSTEPPPKKARKEKKSGGAIGWLALLIALLALAGVAYGWWLLQQAEDSKAAEQNRLSQSQQQLVDSFKTSTKVLSEQVKSFVSKADSQQTRLEELQTQLQSTNRQIGEVTQVSRRSWMLAEAEYLLRLANQRLLMERETASALALLSSADEILVTVAEPGLFEVRQALAREIAELRGIAHLDVEGVFVKLSALGEQVETLELLTPEVEEQEQAQVPAEEAEPSVLDAALDRFGSMVTVRRRDVPLEPLLTPEQHYYVQQNLRLMLEQAQLALLQRKEQIYARSLEKAEQWIGLYFQLNESARAIQATLRELQPLDINPELPDISASLALLKAYIKTPLPGDDSPAATAAVNQTATDTANGAEQ